jgi:hypothetical protein
MIICSRFTSRTAERGGNGMVSSRFISDSVLRCAIEPWKMADKVDDSIGKVHREC